MEEQQEATERAQGSDREITTGPLESHWFFGSKTLEKRRKTQDFNKTEKKKGGGGLLKNSLKDKNIQIYSSNFRLFYSNCQTNEER